MRIQPIVLVGVLLLLVPAAAAQPALDVEPGMIAPDSPLYGLGVAKDNVMMGIGLASPGDIAQKRAAEAQQMREEGNYAAAERAARELSSVAERAGEADADGVQKAAVVLQDIHDNAPDEAKEGLETALDRVSEAGPEDTPAAPGDAPEGSEEVEFTRTEVSCDDGLFETHAHVMPQELGQGRHVTVDSLAQRMSDRDDVSNCGVMFLAESDMENDFAAIQEELAATGVGVVPFVSPDSIAMGTPVDQVEELDIGTELAALMDRVGDDAAGFGEAVTYAGPLEGSSLQDEPWPTIFEKAAEHDLVVMLHLTAAQADELEDVVAQHPDVDFLLHGTELVMDVSPDFLPTLLAEHDNVYWTQDFARFFGPQGQNPIEMNSKEEFDTWWNNEADQERIIQEYRDELLTLLEAAPNKVMWGTDISAGWHTEPEGYGALIDISNRIVNSLPEEHRDAYAYENAQNLFGLAIGFEAPEDYNFSAADADSVQPDDGTGDTGDTTTGGLGDLCSSLEECATYCRDNQQDCIDYCMTDPGNAVCQELSGDGGGPSGPASGGQSSWNLAEDGVPRFITHAVEPNVSKVTTVSKFRSAAGHDYSTDMERCRTMKHYINGPQDGDPLPVVAPADGMIDVIQTEQSGGDALVFIKPEGYPAFTIRQHHVTLEDGIEEGTTVTAGDTIGVRSFIGGKWDTASAGEIAISVNTPEGRTFVSYFDAMTDDVFQRYQEAHGVESRDAFIISQAERDADPLDCNEDSREEEYTGRVNNPDWSLEQFGEWAYSSDNWVFFEELEARR